jgi:arabinose-5-phosphate isomerase
MSAAGLRTVIPHSQLEQLREARAILRVEAEAVLDVVDRLGESFCAACELLRGCGGSTIVTGMGKAGLVGRKIAATMSSTGTRARFLHPADAVHGDLGFVQAGDVALALSNSGETAEVCQLAPLLRRLGATIVAITARDDSTLGRSSDLVISLGELREAGPHGLAPTTSTTVMIAVGDALALVVSRMKGFSPHDFATYHPGGNLGARMRTVRETMRSGAELRVASQSRTIRSVVVDSGNTGRRTGAVMLVDDDGRLSGLFTDSDLARLLASRRDDQLDRPIAGVMTRQPLTVPPDLLLHDVIGLLSRRKFSEIPVVDEENRPIGLVDITDVIGYEADGGGMRDEG